MSPRIHIVHVGKPSAAYQPALERYKRLVRPYSRIELRSVRAGKGRAQAAMEQEARMLQDALPGRAWRVALTEEARVIKGSRAFAAWLGRRRDTALPLVFTIGGAHGLAASVKDACNETMGLSPLTFSHDLALLVLMEQLYRAFTILNRHPYHK